VQVYVPPSAVVLLGRVAGVAFLESIELDPAELKRGGVSWLIRACAMNGYCWGTEMPFAVCVGIKLKCAWPCASCIDSCELTIDLGNCSISNPEDPGGNRGKLLSPSTSVNSRMASLGEIVLGVSGSCFILICCRIN